jgi:branched-chain amino acid transport system substrate-binding protein
MSFAVLAETITVAVIAPKQGEYKKEGEELFDGARLAIDELNLDGGVNGKKIDILTIDDRCDDRLAVSTAEMLALLHSKKIGLVVGPYCSNRFAEIANIYESSKIFQIVPTTVAYSKASLDKKGQIMFLGTKSQMSGDFFRFYNQNFAGLKVGFVYDDNENDGYSEVASSLFSEFKKFGKSELLKFYPLNGGTDISDLVDSLKKDNISISFVLSRSDLASDFVLRVKKNIQSMIVFTAKDMINEKTYEEIGKESDGIYVLALKSFKDSLMFTEDLVNMRLNGIEPKGMEVYSYAAVKLWSDIARGIGRFDYDKLRDVANGDELKEKWQEFMMHSGSISSSRYSIEMFNDGNFRQVY